MRCPHTAVLGRVVAPWSKLFRTLTITVRTYRPGDEPTVRKGGAVLPGSNAAASEAARRDRGRTTLAAIAAEAGVSLPTVSKVVNGRRDVAPATRALVERLLNEHQYTRAGTRRHRRSGLIDLVFNGLDSPWAVEILRGVEDWCAGHGMAEIGRASCRERVWR